MIHKVANKTHIYREIKRANLLDLSYISLDYIRFNNDNYNKAFNKYNMLTFKDLDDEIRKCNPEIITLKGLLYENYKVKNHIDIPLSYISTKGLYKANYNNALLLLEGYGIENFQELEYKYLLGQPEFVENIYLKTALTYVKGLIKTTKEELVNTRVRK